MLDKFNILTVDDISKVQIRSNYHTHNYLCGHAKGNVSDYVAEAVKHGLNELGISDHCAPSVGTKEPYLNEKTIQSKYLPQFKEAERLFGDKIKILSGVEVDYFPDNDVYYKNLLGYLDYLILGQHEYWLNGVRKCSFCDGIDEENIIAYCEQIKQGLQTGLFSGLAHPDLIFYNVPKPTERMKNAFETVVAEAKLSDVPLELNANGVRSHGGKYPTDLLIELCKKYNAKIIISSDCHEPQGLCDECVLKLYAYAKKQKLNITDSIKK